MTRTLTITALVFVGAIVVAAIWFFFFYPKSQPSQTVPVVPTLPVSGSVATSSNATPGTPQVPTRGGGTVAARDFIDNGVTIPDAANKGHYLLVGRLGYCPGEERACRAGSETSFSVVYDTTYGSFNIALLQEPLGETRLAAEQYLRTALGISSKDMCRLNYYVGTTFDVSEIYSTENLGFSFCPGAVPLPQ